MSTGRARCAYEGCEGGQVVAGSTGYCAYYEPCPGCGGTGYAELRENLDARSAIDAIKGFHREEIIHLLRDAERLDADRLARIDEQDKQIERLTTEVRRLNELVTKQARLLDRSEPARVTYAKAEGAAH